MTAPLRIGRPVKVAFVATISVCVLLGVWFVGAVLGAEPNRPDIFDFNVFHLAGRLIWSGHLEDAYRSATMRPLETALGHGRSLFIPFSYPPCFGFLLAGLGALPPGLAYLVFTLGTTALFCFGLRRLAGVHFWPLILAAAPAIIINIRAGQNGLLSGGLCAIAALGLLRSRPVVAGWWLGCFAFKPHLVPVLPLMLILQKRWLALAVAAAVAVGLTGLSIAVFGAAVFSAFLDGTAEVRRFMAIGAYPLYRMTSIYASLLSLGVPSGFAIAFHGVCAVAVLASAAWVIRRTEALPVQIGASATAGAFVSPYFYDYDLTVFAVGLLLLAPALTRRMTAKRYGMLLFCVAAGQSAGIALHALGVNLSIGGPVLLAAYVTMWRQVHADIEDLLAPDIAPPDDPGLTTVPPARI